MRVVFFWRKGCIKCPEAKRLLDQLMIESYKSFNIDTEDGLTEASFYNVMSTPSILILDENDEESAGWRGIIPSGEELLNALK